jgi:hypothetical protein
VVLLPITYGALLLASNDGMEKANPDVFRFLVSLKGVSVI